MKNKLKILFLSLFTAFIFVSCGKGSIFWPDDTAFLEVNCYNNVDDEVVTLFDTAEREKFLPIFNYEGNKEGYYFYGGYSEPNGQGKQLLDRNFKFVQFGNGSKRDYYSVDVYLHYEKIDTDGCTQVIYNIPENCYLDGELPGEEFEIGKSYQLPNCYKDRRYFNGWKFDIVYDDFTYGKLTLTQKDGVMQGWKNKVPTIVVYPDLSYQDNDEYPYYIWESEHFSKIKKNPSAKFEIIKDLDFTGVNYTPFEFKGTLDGNGYTIKNLTITTENTNAGLFTKNTGTITSVKLENLTINSNNTKTSYIGGLCGVSTGKLYGIVIKNSVINSETGVVGGIVGQLKNAKIEMSSARATINSGNDTNSYVGGVVGEAVSSSLLDVYSYCEINAPSTTVGGIVGSITSGTIKRCENNGNVKATGSAVGGIVGKTDRSTISEVVNKGNIEGTNSVGGIIGLSVSGTNTDYKFSKLTNEGIIFGHGNAVGGIIGKQETTNNTYNFSEFTNKGKVEAQGNCVGGIIGYLYSKIDYSDDETYSQKFTTLINEGFVTGVSNIGGLIGEFNVTAHNQWGRHPGNIISLNDSINTGDILGSNYCGGLIGKGVGQEDRGSVIKNSTSTCTVEADHTIGGICGYINFVKVDSCSNEGSNIIATGEKNAEDVYARVGGYCGVGTDIVNCVNNVDIIYSGNGSQVGGIVGLSNGDIKNCTNNALIDASNSSCVGGIIGRMTLTKVGTLDNLLNEGDVKGSKYVGGIMGDYDCRFFAQSNDTFTVKFNKLINKGNIQTETGYAGVLGRVVADGTDEYLRFPKIKVNITYIENYGDITVINEEFLDTVGVFVGYFNTDSNQSTLTYYVSSCKINSVLVSIDKNVGESKNLTISEGEFIIR